MDRLGETFQEALLGSLHERVADRIVDKLAAQGMTIGSRQRIQILQHLRSRSDEPLQLHSWRWWENADASVEISDQDVADILERFGRFLDDNLGDLMLEMVDDLSVDLLHELHRRWGSEQRRQSRDRRQFNHRLRSLWGEALDRFEMCLVIARELGEAARIHLLADPTMQNRALPGVLIHLHARTCQIADEVLCLLESGFADGAMARWRTMHEIAVVALFLQEHGDDVASRYVDHEVVESFRAAKDYRSCSERLRYEPMGDDEFQSARTAYDEMIQRHGKSFGSQYGWAASALNRPSPTFRDIEASTGIDHLRAHYRMASHNVHANPKGVFFRLGLLEESDTLLAGPSNAGLADPGHSAAISLMHVTVALCLLSSTMDTVVGLKVMMRLVDEIGDCFGDASSQLSGSVD